MVAIITGALGLPNKKAAFLFTFLLMDTNNANPEDVKNWQISSKKIALKKLRAIGLEHSLCEKHIMFAALDEIETETSNAIPEKSGGFNFEVDVVDSEEVEDLIKLDKTFIEKY